MASGSMPNWLGLLRWSMSVNDGTVPSQYSAMEETDKQWLEQVMNEVVRSDPQRMDEVMLKVKDFLVRAESSEGSTIVVSEDEEEALLVDLEDLRDIVEQIDMAQVFAKFGGCDILLKVGEMDRFPKQVRSLSVAIIGTVAQNNLTVQDSLYKQGILQRLCRLLQQLSSQQDSLMICRKAIFALSTLVRGHAAAEEHFALQELHNMAIALLPIPILRAKLYFLASALVESDSCSEARISAVVRALLLSLFSLTVPRDSSADAEGESLEFGMVLLKDLLHTRIGQQLLLLSRAIGREGAAAAGEVGSDEADEYTAQVATSLATLQQEPLSMRLERTVLRWQNGLMPSEDEESEGRRSILRQHLQSLAHTLFEEDSSSAAGRRWKEQLPAMKYPREEGSVSASTAASSETPPPRAEENILLIAPPPLEAAPRAP